MFHACVMLSVANMCLLGASYDAYSGELLGVLGLQIVYPLTAVWHLFEFASLVMLSRRAKSWTIVWENHCFFWRVFLIASTPIAAGFSALVAKLLFCSWSAAV